MFLIIYIRYFHLIDLCNVFKGVLPTVCSDVVYWEVVYMSHVTNSRENHKAGQDTGE